MGKNIALTLAVIVVGLAFGLCITITESNAQTVLTDVWKDKEYLGVANKISVFCITQNRARRIQLEDEFVRQLKARGITGIPGYVIIPPDKMVEKEAALDKIRSLGADAILSVRLIDKLTARTNIPEPTPKGHAESTTGMGFYEYVYSPTTIPEGEPAYLETLLFDARTGRRVWAARSVTKVDAADKKIVLDFIGGMIERLASDGMIK